MKPICSIRDPCRYSSLTERNRFVSSPSTRTGAHRMTPAKPPPLPPPARVEGDREQEILDAALEVLAEVGYDRLTMDAVAQRAKAPRPRSTGAGTPRPRSSWTRWPRMKTTPATARHRRPAQRPDGGVLRHGRPHRPRHHLDVRRRDHRAAPPTRSSPRSSARRSSRPSRRSSRTVFERARDRGEIRADLDLDLIVPALAGIVLHRVLRPRRAARRGAHRARHRPDHPAGCQAAGLRPVTQSQATEVKKQGSSCPTLHRNRRRVRAGGRPTSGTEAAPRLGPGADLHRPADGGARRHHRQHRPALHRQGPRTCPARTSPGSSPATRSPSAACCCSAAGSATSTAAAGSS